MAYEERKKKANPKNYLDSFDFCLRKAIAIHVFGNRDNETMAEFAKAIGTTQPMLSKWISQEKEDGSISSGLESRHVPNTAQLLQASAYLSMPLLDMIDKAVEGEKKNHFIPAERLEEMKELSKALHKKGDAAPANRLENRTQDYLKKINRTGNAQYVAFFLQEDKIEHMIIEAYDPYETGSVPMTARIIGKAGNAYRGHIVSPPGNDHLFFYIRQEDGKNDRGLMVFYIDDDIQDKYQCGSGILLSTDRKSGEIRLQWVIIIRTESTRPVKKKDTMQVLQNIQQHAATINPRDEKLENSDKIKRLDLLVKPLLEEKLPLSKSNIVFFDKLRNRQRTLFDIYNKSNTDIATAEERVKIAEAEYKKALNDLEEIKKIQTKD